MIKKLLTKPGVQGYLACFTQSAFLSMKGLAVKIIKYNREFYRILRELEESQWYSRDKFKELQDTQLRSLIEHAYENVPYYNKLFKRQGIRPVDIQDSDDLKKIPVLTKKILRTQPEDFVARNVNRKLLASGWTTGTTGAPINALRSRKSIIFENAMIWRQRRWVDADTWCRKVAVWGTIWDNVIIPSYVKRPPFWRINITENQILFSYYHMSNDTLPLYFEKLDKFKPVFIEGFPSTILTLANFLKKKKRFFPVKAIFTSSEPLYKVHRDVIEERFQTKIFDLYGQAERVVAATECSEHKGLHVNPEYGILELIKNDYKVSEGREGEIIGTGLNNYVMPLIRYQTGDLARFSDEICSCGRQMPLLQSVEGRMADRIMTPDGRIIPGGGIMGAFHGIGNIKESRVFQEDISTLVIEIAKNDEREDIDVDSLVVNLKSCVGDEIRIVVNVVDALPDNDTIKRRWVVSKVRMDEV